MTRSLAKTISIKFPDSLAEFLNAAPLVGDETLESYNAFFAGVVADLKPADLDRLAVYEGCGRFILADPPRENGLSGRC